MSTRRDFIKSVSLITAGTMIIPWGSCSASTYETGVALYTVRDQMMIDPERTLGFVAKIGYKNLELAGYANGKFYGFTPEEFKQIVEDLGMRLISSHTLLTEGNYQVVLEDAAKAGIKYVVQPVLLGNYRQSIDTYKQGAEQLNKFGEFARNLDIRLGYHNHDFEFKKKEEILPYDILIENTDPGLVTMELDLYWIIKAGNDPLIYFDKYPGRFELWHIKDMDSSIEQSFTEVGQGTIDFETIFAQKEKAGFKYYFVEQDVCRNHAPLESIRISHNYLTLKKF